MKEILEYVVRAIVDEPDAVRVVETRRDDGTILLDLSVSEGDMGRVIGRRGHNIQAIRSVIRAAAIRAGVHARIELSD